MRVTLFTLGLLFPMALMAASDCPSDPTDAKAAYSSPASIAVAPEKPSLEKDPAFLIGLDDLQKALKSKRPPLLIDIRLARQFEAAHLPGALNVRPHALKYKTYLKQREMVLIGEGYEYRTLLPTLTELKAEGFSGVRLLEGGLNLWRRKGLPLVGDYFAADAVQRLSPHAYQSERDTRQWLVLDVTPKGLGETGIAAATIHLPYGDANTGFEKRFEAAVADYPGKTKPVVLIVDAGGENTQPLKSRLAGYGDINLFFLEGGVAEWRTYLRRVQTTLASKNRPTAHELKARSCS